MERFGLVGLPNAGKSSLYNALTGGGALAAPYAFATKDPNVGVAKVPDERLDRLAAMCEVARTSCRPPCSSSTSAGWSRAPARARAWATSSSPTSARSTPSCFVLRAFADDDVPGPSDPLEHLRVVEIELALADLETVEKQLDKRRKAAKLDKSLADEVAALEAALRRCSAEGTPLYRADLERRRTASCSSRTSCSPTSRCWPSSTSARTTSTDIDRRRSAPVAAELRPATTSRSSACACSSRPRRRQLDADERAEMLEGLGLGEGALPRFVRAAYHLLGLRTFLTTGEKESPGLDVPRRLQGARVRRA